MTDPEKLLNKYIGCKQTVFRDVKLRGLVLISGLRDHRRAEAEVTSKQIFAGTRSFTSTQMFNSIIPINSNSM